MTCLNNLTLDTGEPWPFMTLHMASYGQFQVFHGICFSIFGRDRTSPTEVYSVQLRVQQGTGIVHIVSEQRRTCSERHVFLHQRSVDEFESGKHPFGNTVGPKWIEPRKTDRKCRSWRFLEARDVGNGPRWYSILWLHWPCVVGNHTTGGSTQWLMRGDGLLFWIPHIHRWPDQNTLRWPTIGPPKTSPGLSKTVFQNFIWQGGLRP